MPPPRGTWNPIEGPADYDMTKEVHNDTYPAIDPLNFDFKGKAVYINGASHGIGVAMAVSFAKSGASKIAISGRSDLSHTVSTMREAAQKAGRAEPDILPLKVDLTSEASVGEAARTIEEKFGRLDIVINNAGALTGYNKKILDLSLAEWKMNFEVNLHGTFLVLREMVPLLLRSESGDKTVVTVASVGAHVVVPGLSGYQTSKLALLRLTEFAMAEYADQGLLSYTIHPGNIATDMLGDLPENLVPVFTETAEISADSLVYLTSERREWLAGRYVNVTWDLPELMTKEDELVKGDKLKVRMQV